MSAHARKKDRPGNRGVENRGVGGDGAIAYQLRLYVARQTVKSVAAIANLHRIRETHLAGHYFIEVVDLTKTPQLAAGGQILAVPTLVRRLPAPIKKIIGSLSNEERVLAGLDVRPVAA